jgi:tetratricopeptide (TPR) repeat protein
LDPDRIREALASPVTANLRRYGVNGVRDFLSGLTADGDSLRGWLDDGGTINSFRHPVLEFYSLRAQAVPPWQRAEENLVNLLRGRGESLATLGFASPVPREILADQRALGLLAEAWQVLEQARPGGSDEALRRLDDAARAAPTHRTLQHGAAAAYRRIIKQQRGNTRALVGLGRILLSMGRPDLASNRFREALAADPEDPGALGGLALLLATHADPAVRDPAEAVRIARMAVELTAHRDPRALTALAEAFAASGRVDLAAGAARAALPLAEAEEDEYLAAGLRARLEAFRQAGAPSGPSPAPGTPAP